MHTQVFYLPNKRGVNLKLPGGTVAWGNVAASLWSQLGQHSQHAFTDELDGNGGEEETGYLRGGT